MAKTNLPGTWRRSSYSGTNGECVEASTSRLAVTVRDSKNAGGTSLVFGHAAWQAFTAELKASGRAKG